jgi:cysteine synthase
MSSKGVAGHHQAAPAAPSLPVLNRMDEWVGNTPLVRLQRMGKPGGAPIFVKMENLNPSGSMRDRYISEILERAAMAGSLVAGDTVALAGLDDSAASAALIAGVLGVKTQIFAPKDASRRLLPLVHRYGAKVLWTDADHGVAGAVEQAADWARQASDRMYVDSYRREAVRDAYAAIASETLQALDGHLLGAFITSVTTGGTFRHVARELRQSLPSLRVGGAVLLDVEWPSLGEHQFDQLRHFSETEVWALRDEIARKEGLLLGPKGAACVGLALELQHTVSSDEPIVALNPDSGQRYLGWENQPLFKKGYLP